MLYRIKRRKSGCRAPPWGTYRDFSTLQWKTADFSCRYHRFNGGSMAALHRKKGRARQITNGVSSDDTAVVPGDIMPFLGKYLKRQKLYEE